MAGRSSSLLPTLRRHLVWLAGVSHSRAVTSWVLLGFMVAGRSTAGVVMMALDSAQLSARRGRWVLRGPLWALAGVASAAAWILGELRPHWRAGPALEAFSESCGTKARALVRPKRR